LKRVKIASDSNGGERNPKGLVHHEILLASAEPVWRYIQLFAFQFTIKNSLAAENLFLRNGSPSTKSAESRPTGPPSQHA